MYASPEAALFDLHDGASIAVSGFGTSYGFACSLLLATHDKGVKDLTLVSNALGAAGQLRGVLLVAGGQVSKLIVSFTSRPGMPTAADEQIEAGQVQVELVPQGTLVERMRAAGAGIPAFYTPVGVGTPIAAGKEVRLFNGRLHILEQALPVDFAFLRAYRGDRLGNIELRGSSRNFVPAFAKAARVAIVEVDEIVEVGEIPAERVGLPGILVTRVVQKTVEPEQALLAPRRAADVPRQYHGKPGWTRAEMARRTALLLAEGSYVNLGTGMPTLVSNYIEGRDITLHGENGILGYGPMVSGEQIDRDVFNASGQFVAELPGASFFDSVASFEMARSGKLDAVVLGAYQVDQAGNLANFSLGDPRLGGIGGAMDLVAGKQLLIVMMEHQDSRGRPKLVRQTAYPLTGVDCVDVVVTDLAILRRVGGQFLVAAVADGFSFEEVQSLTEMDIRLAAGSVRT
ncbi:MAG TPA: 3-oxoacid CoA-transferase subunit A [Chloroflexota bacterium]|nr:3-oxoacid CoA-transferase subunit A [Chloroflexota bacterium]